MADPGLIAGVRWGALGALILTSLAIMGSPGPATISLTAAGSAYGVRRSLAYLSGIIVGSAAVLLAVATGITATLLTFPAARTVLLAAAAVYILWLAYHIATAAPLAQQTPSSSPLGARGGFLLGITNPKAWIAIAAVFASAHLARHPTLDAVAKVGVLSVMIGLINGTWLVAGASLAPLLRDPRRARVFNVVLAVALVAATAVALVR